MNKMFQLTNVKNLQIQNKYNKIKIKFSKYKNEEHQLL